MEKEQLLRDPGIFPSDTILAIALGESYNAFKTFTQKLPEMSVEMEWRYYNDGKNWLGKGLYKKKTMFWLSVWDKFFKLGFFFNEKTRDEVFFLPISDEIKESFANAKTIGKLFALGLEIDDKSVLDDVYTLIKYKQSIK